MEENKTKLRNEDKIERTVVRNRVRIEKLITLRCRKFRNRRNSISEFFYL